MAEVIADSPTATERVLNLPELIEQILVNVRALKLYQLQRINSTFQAVIKDSKQIRQIMLLEAGSRGGKTKVNKILTPLRRSSAIHPLKATVELSEYRKQQVRLNTRVAGGESLRMVDKDYLEKLFLGTASHRGSWEDIRLDHLGEIGMMLQIGRYWNRHVLVKDTVTARDFVNFAIDGVKAWAMIDAKRCRELFGKDVYGTANWPRGH